MGEKRNIVKRLFWLNQASICLHDIPKDAKIQDFGGIFSTFLDLLKISLKIMIQIYEYIMEIHYIHYIFKNPKSCFLMKF